MTTTKPTYYPNTVRSLFTAHSSLAAIVAFSAKERDLETGLSYFGSRYYSSDLSIWLSVDPMCGKYPSLSPYVYCADNPVKLVDPNGEAYEVIRDDETNTLTIKAIYYTSNDNKDKLKEGLDIWNSTSFTYSTGKGKNKTTYNVKFDLTIAEGDYTDENATLASSDFNISIGNFVGSSNKIFNEQDDAVNGESDGHIVHLRPEATVRTVAHEVGHTLGIGDWELPSASTDTYDYGKLMTSGGSSSEITRSHVATILYNKGYGPKNFTWGICINPSSNFSPYTQKMSGVVKKH